jgi:putative peptide zinc metalloprotease protein
MAIAGAPKLATGVEQLGEYRGSGLTEATYLARNPDGRVVHVSRLLHLVLSEVDGTRTASEIANRVTAAFGRTVSSGNVEYLLANKLAPLGLLATSDQAGSAHVVGQNQAILALRLRRTLLPAPAVQQVARLLRPLFSPVAVVAVLACLIASGAWLIGSGRFVSAFRYVLLHPVLLLLVLGLSLLSMLFHECGHAAACRYGGARPGVIGMGFYIVWPAFYTNVTDAYRLGRAARIRTDLGGVYFNGIFTLPLAAAYLATGYPPLLAAIVLIYLEISQQLVPSLRFDGYFILADLIGVPDLFRRVAPTLRSVIPGRPADPMVRALKPAARITLTAWVLVIVPLIATQLMLIILNAPGLARTFAHSLDAQAHTVVAQFGGVHLAAGLVGLISALLLILPAAGLCYVLLVTGRRTLRFVIGLNRRHPALRYPSVAAVLLSAAALAVHWGLLPL